MNAPRKNTAALSQARPLMLLPGERQAPTEFCVFRFGENQTVKGTFLFDEQAAASVMERYAARGLDLMFDYEHQSLHDPPIVAPASATQWTPQIRNGELWATDIKWTDAARAMIEAGEYRYFSPAFRHEEETMRVVEMINVALTNTPAMDNIAPLVAARATEKPMDFEKLYNELKAQLAAKDEECKALSAQLTALKAKDPDEPDADDMKMSATVGLRAASSKSERLSAVTSLAALRTDVRRITGQETDAGVIGVLTAWKDVQAEASTLRSKLAEIETKTLKSEFDSMLNTASTEGKLPPAKRADIEAMALKIGGGKLTADGVEAARTTLSILAPVVSRDGAAPRDAGGMLLSPTELEIAKQTGSDIKALEAFKAKRLQGRV